MVNLCRSIDVTQFFSLKGAWFAAAATVALNGPSRLSVGAYAGFECIKIGHLDTEWAIVPPNFFSREWVSLTEYLRLTQYC